MFTPPDDSRLVGYARVSTGGEDLDLQRTCEEHIGAMG
jgi:DNA invertase Pin-like site-specific DNA recombinase